MEGDLEARLAPPAVETIALQLLSGLEALHAQGVFHRDLKPGA